MSETVISVKDLCKSYRIYPKPIDRLKETLSPTKKEYGQDFFALKDISFEIKKGENIGIIGTNGSGKSTLLKIITGVLSPSSGEVEVKGKIAALLELGAGFNPEYTGVENIRLNGTMMGFTDVEMDGKMEDILSFADIGDFVHQPVKTYSSGMFARLAFAVAINVEPDILIVDEALSVGDMRFQLKCMQKMKEMMSGGTTVLFVSHDINAIKRFCSRGIWINRGIFQVDGDIDMVTDRFLDFLKLGDISETVNVEKKEEERETNEPAFVKKEDIAEIIAFYVKNKEGHEVDSLEFQEHTEIEVVYDVYDDDISSPVLGIAVYSLDMNYICGLNTCLDQVQIPWRFGRNRMRLIYPSGLLVLGGTYYFDTALEDETATVDIHRICAVKEITVTAPYVGEGTFIIPHEWREIQ